MQKYNLKLISTVFVAGSLVSGVELQKNECDFVYQSFNQLVKSLNKAFQDFFSMKNNDSIGIFLVQFKELREQIEKDLQELEKKHGVHPAISELISYGKDILRQFIIFIGVVEKFEKEPAGKSIMFATELKKAIDIKKIFSDIIAKVQGLQSRHASQDKNLVELQSKLVTSLQSIAKQWEPKGPDFYLNGLKYRMNCKRK